MSVVRRNVIANLIGKGWNAVLTIGFVPVAIHYVGLEGYGLLILLTTFQAIVLMDFGLSFTVTRELARLSVTPDSEQESNDLLRTFATLAWCVGAAAAFLVVLIPGWAVVAWLKPVALSKETVATVFLMIGLILGLHFPMNLYLAGLGGLQNQVTANLVSTGFASVRVLGGIAVMAFATLPLESFLLWYAVLTLLQTLCCGLLLWRKMPRPEYPAQFRFSAMRQQGRQIAGVTAVLTTAILWLQMDRLLAPGLLSLEGYARYALAALLGGMAAMIAGSIVAAVTPQLACYEATKDRESLSRFYHAMTQVMAVTCLPICVAIALFSQELMFAWTGDPGEARQARETVVVIAIAYGFLSLICLPYHTLLVHRKNLALLRVNVAILLVGGPMVVVLAVAYGGVGVAVGWLMMNLIYLICLVRLVDTEVLPKEMGRWLMRDISPSLLAALVVGACCKFALPEFTSRWAILLGVSGIGLAMTLAAAFCAPLVVERLARVRWRHANPPSNLMDGTPPG